MIFSHLADFVARDSQSENGGRSFQSLEYIDCTSAPHLFPGKFIRLLLRGLTEMSSKLRIR